MAVDRKPLRKAPDADVVEVLTAQETQAPRGPGPGRPRSKRRMEPFSSKIEIQLRDSLDEYLAMNGITIIDFLDEAIRDRLAKK